MDWRHFRDKTMRIGNMLCLPSEGEEDNKDNAKISGRLKQ